MPMYDCLRFEFKVTMDERVTDGFYAAGALKRMKHLIEHPRDL